MQRPSGDNPPWWPNSTNMPGVDITITPPASANEHSPLRSDCTAKCSATNDDEHAVSTVTAGPSRPSVYATLPEMMLAEEPVSRCPSVPSTGSCRRGP
ncbi:hypothetical protein GCM10022247_37830 [Allokutzneria multivorans]|uniref:Uncharacterized protein n=1 Tax=Allokutzneria multivorans TaxID=1142134 RepID=A0ABP7SHL3_9PSEU